ncbi:uncharacterized protein CXorf38-like isoform X2 [Mya arenaria]|uniref:uncharacterized protein CXorf38-like isoform X2 n=1 Tax=Mya arenaria TaxID=6604 RepID=UPI0022E3D342|nr:uncharacterized protein CXorf38-like isoform X2 [Mya arenaria]
MSSYKRLFDEKNNQNWLKVSLGISLTKTALEPFVANVIEQFQNDGYKSILQKKCLLPGVSCRLCSTQNVIQCPTQGICKYLRNRTCKFHQNHTYRQCPSKICNDFREWIQIHHRFGGPSWRNSDAGRWSTDWWEIAKCYLPPDGYFGVHTVEMSDFNGLISVIMNCKYFQNYFTDNLAADSNVCTKVREIGRKLRHAPGLLVTDEDWKSCSDALKDLLQDPKYMKGDNHTKDAVDQLNKLEQDTLKVSDEEVLKVLQDSAETLKRLIEDSNIIKEKT